MNKQTKIIMVMVILLIGLISYISYDKYSESQLEKLNNATIIGINYGYTQAFIEIYQTTNDCQITTMNIGNVSRGLVDVGCLQEVKR